MWGYNTNMGQFGGPMTPQMNMGGGPRGFSPWMQGIPNGFQPPNFANNMGEVFGGMPGGGGPMQFNMGGQPGKSPGNPMTNMPGQAPNPQMPIGGMQPGRRDMSGPNPGVFMRGSMPDNPNPWTVHGSPSGGANPPNFFPGFGGGKPGGGQGGILPWLLPQGQGGGGQTRPMEIPPHIAQILGYTKPTNDIGKESPPSKGDNGWLNNMLRSNPYMGGIQGGRSIGGFNPRIMGGGRGMGLGMGMRPGMPQTNQQLAEQYFMNTFGGGGMGNPNAPYSTNPNHMVYM